LYAKMQQEVAARPLQPTESGWQLTADRGSSGTLNGTRTRAVPLLVIDGKAFTWEQIGRILMRRTP